MDEKIIVGMRRLGFPWETVDPFLFCVHHNDAYPAGNEHLGPAASLAGRDLGQDFANKDGWNMYHGRSIPGFPQHPHRGFETVTIVRRGYIDHSDSLGAKARFGQGDVQWLTAGKGIVHSEMFPLLSPSEPNPVELFQIWLNLPSADKFVEPHFSMLWNEKLPRKKFTDEFGAVTDVCVIAGRLGDAVPPAPPPNSWASKAQSDLAIWTLTLSAGARWTLPPAKSRETRRVLYFFKGSSVSVAGEPVRNHSGIELNPEAEVELVAGPGGCEMLLLQGRPLREPVATHGPFVMNTRAELVQAFNDYQRTRFGGWPWPDDAPVHGKEIKRFAQRPHEEPEVP